MNESCSIKTINFEAKSRNLPLSFIKPKGKDPDCIEKGLLFQMIDFAMNNS